LAHTYADICGNAYTLQTCQEFWWLAKNVLIIPWDFGNHHNARTVKLFQYVK